MNEEQSRTFFSKPISRMRWFASLLGWRGLELWRTTFSQEEIDKYSLPTSGIITFYMTPDLKFNLQINENSLGQSVTHQATIKADRYSINNIGWHAFSLFDDNNELKQEAERLRPWLNRNLYKNPDWVRNFKVDHPDMLLPSRKKRRGRGTLPG